MIRFFSGNMNIAAASFNTFLLSSVLLAPLFCAAAETEKKEEEKNLKKQASTLRLFLEIAQGLPDQGHEVSLFRASPVKINVEKAEFLSEGDVEQVRVLDEDGVVRIKIQFDKRATWLLENITASNIGKHIAIFSNFGEARWLAAPMISRRIGDGVLTFTPDANRQEAERIARGLNNLAAKLKKKSKF
jgi:hypothetical protein